MKKNKKKAPKRHDDELRKDTKSYYVAAVLDRAESDRMLRPLPEQVQVLDKAGRRLTLTVASPPSTLRPTPKQTD